MSEPNALSLPWLTDQLRPRALVERLVGPPRRYAKADAPLRDRVADLLVSAGKPVYAILRHQRQPWAITKAQLRRFDENTVGHALAAFLDRHGFELIPRAEFHDVFHVLFGLETSMREETSLQFVVIGNGKWSLPNVASSAVAWVLYPENWTCYRDAFLRGKRARTFHDMPLERLLAEDLESVRARLGL